MSVSASQAVQVGDRVLIRSRRFDGEPATVVSIDPLTGWVHATLERHRNNKLYCRVPYGPFIAKEIQVRGQSKLDL